MLRTNTNTIEGAHCITTSFFDGFCKKETEAGRDVFFGEKYVELHHKRRSRRLTATAFPKRDSQLEQSFISEL